MAEKERQETNPLALAPASLTATAHAGPSATISLPQGRYTGVLLPRSNLLPRAVEAWRGIPYAQSTGGANRFRPPVPLPPPPPDAAPEVRTAQRFGQVCPVTMAVARAEWMDYGEDCLNLNVYRPASTTTTTTTSTSTSTSTTTSASCSLDDARGTTTSDKMPVVIYVHGGAFNCGMGTERDMASFVGWSATPIVGVNFNYRVGALGFPSSAVAEREGVLNLGLRDQRLLFEWVRDNIGEFGGDRERVTVMGLSAGAHSIGYHLLSYKPDSIVPFQRAIMESGGPTARATLSPSHPRTETQWREFLLGSGIQPDTTPPDEIFPILRSLPLETIIRASSDVFSGYQDPIRWPFQPVIDGHGHGHGHDGGGLVTDLPINILRRGSHLRIPILTGFNTHEGSMFASPSVDTDDEFLRKFKTMVPGLGTPDLQRLAELYPDPVTTPASPYVQVPPGFGRQWARYCDAYGHYAYICPVLQTGHFYSSSSSSSSSSSPSPNSKSKSNGIGTGTGENTGDDGTGGGVGGEGEGEGSRGRPPVWVYHFAARSRPDLGGTANHGDEAVVVAHDMAAIGSFPGLVRTADAMHGAWAHFIATGDPNAGIPLWPRFSSPFVGDTDASPAKLRRKGDGKAEGDWGHVMMFGSGNDERMGDAGGRNPGVPARLVRLGEDEAERCKFWWERVELSEGMGTRLDHGARAKL